MPRFPERVKRQALVDLAFHLSREQRISCPREEALEVVARALPQGRPEEVLGACARHGLLAGEETLWFAPHQTVQEHFAALALREMAERERGVSRGARLLRGLRRALTGREEGLAALAADDWWTETFVQLAGLVEDADWLAREVARANPWLAWWCTEEGREVSEETREAVAERSTRLLESQRVADRRRAVAALARMRSERVADPLFRAAADEDEEGGGLAAAGTGRDRGDVRTLVAEALAGHGPPPWRAALRCLGVQPDDPLWAAGSGQMWQAVLGQPMVWVPPGPFLMGSDKEKDPQAYDDELPQHPLALPGYWIGRYPVTVAQFRAFVEGSGHRPRDEDSLRGQDDHPVVDVTWHDALAYCRWLAERTGLPVTLPSRGRVGKGGARDRRAHLSLGRRPPDESTVQFRRTGARGHHAGGRLLAARGQPLRLRGYGGQCVGVDAEPVGKRIRTMPEDGREDLEGSGRPRGAWRGVRQLQGIRSLRVSRLELSGRGFYDLGFRVCVVAQQK